MIEHKVPSKRDPKVFYTVTDLDTTYECTCPSFKFRNAPCKHIDSIKKMKGKPPEINRPTPTNNRSLDSYFNRNLKK